MSDGGEKKPEPGFRSGFTIAAWFAAVQFLTRIPVPAGSISLRETVVMFPIVGAMIGLVAGATVLLGSCAWPMGVAAILGVAVQIGLTGALHEDAIADFSDAFGGGWTRDDVLRILDDSRIGAFGAIAVVLVILLRVATLAALGADEILPAMIAAATFGRWAMVAAMTMLPPIADRTSLANDGAGPPVRRTLLWASVAAIPGVGWWLSISPVRSLIAAAAVVGVTAWVVIYVRRRIGGITGDCIGTVCCLSEAAVLLCAAARWSSL